MKTYIYFFIFSIVFDLITTFVGLNVGLVEAHPAGLNIVVSMNIFIICFILLFKNKIYIYCEKHNHKIIKFSLLIVGTFRFMVSIFNIINIIKYGVW